MRTSVLLRHPAYIAYTVECRFHEVPSWIEENNYHTELVYPLSGGFLLEVGGDVCTCLPARVSVIPGGACYRIRHFRRLPDKTLVIRLCGLQPDTLPREVAHLFVEPIEAADLQLSAVSDGKPEVHHPSKTLQRLIDRLLSRVRAAALPHAWLAGRAAGLERALERLLCSNATATVEDCARAAGCGEHHFRHAFRERYATTPHAVRRTLHLGLALRFMLDGGTATAAARVAGFAHVSHLSVEFRRLTGHAPSALLNAHHM